MLRFTILVALGLEAAFWLYLAGTGVADNLDFAKGMGHWVATAATAVLVLLAFPALTLAACNLRIRLAAILTAVVALLYAYPFVASLPKLSNGTLGLWALLAAVLIGCGAIWNRPRRADEAPPEPLSDAQVQHRITFLYGAGLLTLIWLACFIPVVKVWGTGRADGFEAIQPFMGTIFYVALMIPLTIWAVRGPRED